MDHDADDETRSAGRWVAMTAVLVLVAVPSGPVYWLTGWTWLPWAAVALCCLAGLCALLAAVHVTRATRRH